MRGDVRTLIVTADDFGADVAVNEGIVSAHRDGILTCASLMVGGAAAEDAVARARTMPSLGVGLHLVLVDGRPMLPPTRVPDLVGRDGRFRSNMAGQGVRFLVPPVHRQLEAEIEAQFAAFAATGLPLDHVNAHKHFHLHPAIAGLILRIGARYGLRAARAPVEPVAILRGIEPVRVGLAGRVAAPWAKAVARRFRRRGIAVPDAVFGLAWSGGMTEARVRALVERLPPGVSELYAHPATGPYPGSAQGYAYAPELAALMSPAIRAAVTERGVRLARFADLTGERTP